MTPTPATCDPLDDQHLEMIAAARGDMTEFPPYKAFIGFFETLHEFGQTMVRVDNWVHGK